jgi:hypothetical protein
MNNNLSKRLANMYSGKISGPTRESNEEFQKRMEEHRETIRELLDEFVNTLEEENKTPAQIFEHLNALVLIVQNELPEPDTMYDPLPESVRNLAEQIYGIWYDLGPVGGNGAVAEVVEEFRNSYMKNNSSSVYSNAENFLKGGKRKKRKSKQTHRRKSKSKKSKKTRRSKKH